MAAYYTITTFPPLSQLSLIPHEQTEIDFTVLVQWGKSRPEHQFDVEICYSDSTGGKHPSQWTTVKLRRSKALPTSLSAEAGDFFHAAYSGKLAAASGVQTTHILFTVKYRVDPGAPWCWEHIQTGARHGELLLKSNPRIDHPISSVLEVEKGWLADIIFHEGHVCVFSLKSSQSIARESEDDAGLESCVLGRAVGQLRFLAIVRLEPYWLGPRHGADYFHIEEEAVACSFLNKASQVVTILAFNGVDDVYTVLRSGENGGFVVCSRNDGVLDVSHGVLVAIAPSYEQSMEAVMRMAQTLVNQTPKVKELVDRANVYIKQQPNEDFYDGLIYCTWNGLGQDLTTEKLVNGLQRLTENDIKISTLLIDDNWQTLGETEHDFAEPFFRGWADFEANKNVSSNGMKQLISNIRQAYPYVQDIGVWHALFGYWGGLATNGTIAKTYKTVQVDVKLMGNVAARILVADASDIHRLYDDFYHFLRKSGIDFVKTDVQHMPSTLTSTPARRALPTAYQSAWTAAHNRHFAAKAISCMSQTPQNLFHSLLQTHTPRILLRNSDDYFPEVPASHAWHIWANAHNSLLTRHLNVLPDWDMFQTLHPFARFHAAARCISGGPVAITDVPSEHDLDLLEEMVALAPDGRSIALRPGVAATTNVWEPYTDYGILQIGTSTSTGTGILGLFNMGEKERPFLLPVTDISGVKAEKVLVQLHRTGMLAGPLSPEDSPTCASLVHGSLPAFAGWDVLTAYPVFNLAPDTSLSVLGLRGKMTGAAAVTACSVQDRCVRLTLKAVGVLGIWVSHAVEIRVLVQGHDVPDRYVTIFEASSGAKRYEIDVLTFWRDKDIFSQGEKVVDVDVHVA